ncbi:MAG: TolC family protein [Dissulfurimicrobium sp.]|uniref:TolC family protein n=1 Tax=Dissulfurimicrobium hydrothermale TaxID=1750598 RepID=UPI001EDADEF5|nr:TolC family protein [Dissulfurimicrobium hydrothermale]
MIHADVRTAYSRLRQARLSEMYIRRQILKDLRMAVENLQRARQQIDQLDIQVKAAREGVRQATAAFNAGLGTNLERLIAQEGLLSAELSLSTAKFNQDVDYLKLLRVTGELNPELFLMPPPTKNNFLEPNEMGRDDRKKPK